MKKIAFYIESMIGGGAEKQLIELVNHLDPAKYEITVISIFKSSVYDGYSFSFDQAFNKNIKYKYLINNDNKMLYGLFNRSYAHLSKKLINKLLIREKYDAEIAYYEGLPAVFVAESFSRSKKYAWLHTDNHYIWNKYGTAELKKLEKVYSCFDEIIAVSKNSLNSFQEFFPQFPVRVIPNGLNLERIDRLKSEPADLPDHNKMTFLAVGRLIKTKGYDRLIRAAKILKDSGEQFRLIIIGDGPLRGFIQNYIEENELQDCISLIGSVQNPYKYMYNADYLVSASYFEGYGLVISEAIACELPVLITDCKCTEELFSSNMCGIVCENSEEGILQMMKTALEDPQMRETFKQECRSRRQLLSVENTVRLFDDLMEGV